MKKYFFLILVFPLITGVLFGQDDDDNRGFSYWNRTKIGGAGGVTPIVGMFDNKEIDKYLTSAGLPVLGSDPMYIVGGEGYGYIMFLKNVRMGGFGGSGTRSVNRIDPVGNIRKEVDYTISYGGFLMDYVQPVAYKLDVAIGATIGAGSVDITMRRDDGTFKEWDSLWTQYGNTSRTTSNYTHRLTGSFVTLNPHVNVEYTLLTWLQLRIGLGYPIMLSPEWKLDEKYDVNSVPSKIKASGYTINAGIMFGYFGW
ncbi:MAG: hypothetical protein HYV29_13305 [Ignavibacteriales bacterium]|nr:hypothetical protein [Ignavibacteriales bacterium]